jgi:hypothetical protein
MLIVNDEHRLRAGMRESLKTLLILLETAERVPARSMNDDAGFHVFHAACAAALALDIQVDLSTFFNPPTPYHRFFVLTGEATYNDEQGGACASNGS